VAEPAEEVAIEAVEPEVQDTVVAVAPDEVDAPSDEELVPTFDGEPIVDSLGWVVTETQEDLYTGWDDYVPESEEAKEETKWVPEEQEAVDERRGPARRPKRKKRGGKSRYARGRGR
jgi:hypothetical protein